VLDDVVRTLSENPQIGQEKKGDLAGVHVYKFKVKTKLLLLAYKFIPLRKEMIDQIALAPEFLPEEA